MEEYELVCKIAEIKSYIASDWPGVEERKRLYEAVAELERMLKEARNEAEDKQKEDREA